MTIPADSNSLLAWAGGQTWAMEQRALEAMTAQLVTLAQGSQMSPRAAVALRPGSVTSGAAEAGIAVIPVTGVLSFKPGPFSSFFGGTTMTELIAEINAAVAAKNVKGILMLFDSPGGIAAGQLEASAAIRAARDRKPVIAMINPLAASAAFWLASQASRVIITPSGNTGSLGVFSMHLSFAEAFRKAGIEATVISSTPEKTEFSPVLKLSDDAKAAAQREVDLIFNDFLKDVALGRGMPVAMVKRDFGRGRVVNARDAVRGGLVDRIGTFEQALSATVLLLHRGERGATAPAGGAALRSSLTPPRPLSDYDHFLAMQHDLREMKSTPGNRRLLVHVAKALSSLTPPRSESVNPRWRRLAILRNS